VNKKDGKNSKKERETKSKFDESVTSGTPSLANHPSQNKKKINQKKQKNKHKHTTIM
jgi:hypothetical protein